MKSFKGSVIERQVGVQPLQPRVLGLDLLEPFHVNAVSVKWLIPGRIRAPAG